MQIDMAHLWARAKSGGRINFAVFAAKSTGGDNAGLLARLTLKARASGLRIDQSALAYESGNEIRYFGDRNLVDYLSNNWLPLQWTHKLTV